MYDEMQNSMHGDQFTHAYILLMHAYCLGIRDLGYSGIESLAYLHECFPDLIRQVKIDDSNPGIDLKLLEHYAELICFGGYGIHSGNVIAAFLNERQYWTTL